MSTQNSSTAAIPPPSTMMRSMMMTTMPSSSYRRPRSTRTDLKRSVVEEEPAGGAADPCAEGFRLDVEEQRILSEILELASDFGNGVDPFLAGLQKQLRAIRAEKQAWCDQRRNQLEATEADACGCSGGRRQTRRESRGDAKPERPRKSHSTSMVPPPRRLSKKNRIAPSAA